MCTANLIVTNHEGQQFPGCRLKGPSDNLPINQLSFDRVLCDVPCSGDGTLRKAPDIWRKWCFHLYLYLFSYSSFTEAFAVEILIPFGFCIGILEWAMDSIAYRLSLLLGVGFSSMLSQLIIHEISS